MRTVQYLMSLTLITAFLLEGCSAMQTGSSNTSGLVRTVVFPLTPQRADTAIRQAIEEGYGTVHRELLGSGRIGYRFSVGTAPQNDSISAEALRDPDGGYLFEVSNRGTTALVGETERNNLLKLIEHQAANLSAP